MDAFGTQEPTIGIVGSAQARPVGAEGSDQPRSRHPDVGRWLKIALCGLAATGFTASLVSVYTGMRDVARTDGGFCASGGPYVIAHQCSAADTRMLLIGILGTLVSGAIFAGFSSWADGPVLVPGLLMWAGLFGALGWNFVQLSGGSGGRGLLITGIVFLAMAAGGALPVAAMAIGWIRRGGTPELPAAGSAMTSIVRASAQIVAPTPGPLGGASTPPSAPIGPTRIVLPPSNTP